MLLYLSTLHRISCCVRGCLDDIGSDGLGKLWERFQACGNSLDEQNALLLSMLWDTTFDRPTKLCNSFFSNMFGVGSGRLAHLRALLDGEVLARDQCCEFVSVTESSLML